MREFAVPGEQPSAREWTHWLDLTIWALAIAAVRPGLAASLLLMGALVIVPLGLRVLRESGGGWMIQVRRFAALALVSSFCLPAGWMAAALAAPWLLVTCEAFVRGAMLARRRWLPSDRGASVASAESLCSTAGLSLLIVAGVSTTLSRGGVTVWQFSDEIILLTGVHFHFAGFALPVLAACAARRQQGWFGWTLAAGVVAGIPLVGIGISFSPLLEWAGSLMLCAACWLLAGRFVMDAAHDNRATKMMLRFVSAASLAGAMMLAAVYASGQFYCQDWLDIPTMIPIHGTANAFGFCLCGLLAESP